MNTHFPDSDLTRHLARKADEFDRLGGSALELGQVLDRAGEIRRGRRMRATMVMAAAVLAIAVPTALLVTGNDHVHKPVTPAKEVKVDRSPITLDGLKQGEAPRVGYVEGSSWHANGSTVELTPTGSVRAAVPLGDAYLVETHLGDGNLRATVVPTPPEFVGQETTWPVAGGLALSSGGNVAAFVQPDGTPVVVQDGGRTSYELPKIPRGTGFEAAAVVGEECRPNAPDSGCAVWVSSSGEQPQTWVVTAEGAVPSDLSIRTVVLTDEAELVTGITEVEDDLTTCSEVLRLEGGAPLWRVCGHHPVAFSPDGTELLGFADGDGLGTTGLAVYDSATGDALLELGTARDAFVPQAIWEDESHLLATVFEKGRWAILRIGLDGNREYAVPPVKDTGDLVSPFVLPAD
jgi:hypothetical protein